MFNHTQFRDYIVVPTLNLLNMYSKDAEELLVFTCAAESNGGTYIKQVNGPALGIYQMEPKTYTDIWQTYIPSKSGLLTILALNFNCPIAPNPGRLIYDLKFASVMTRLFYARFKEPIPSHTDVDAIWDYYKKYYNTTEGKADKDACIKQYNKFTNQKL